MNQSETVQFISRKLELPPEVVSNHFDTTIQYIILELSSGNNVYLPGIGLLEVKHLPGRSTVFLKGEIIRTIETSPKPTKENNIIFFAQSIIHVFLSNQSAIISELGQFHRINRGKEILSSFTPSITLRSRLNGKPEEQHSLSETQTTELLENGMDMERNPEVDPDNKIIDVDPKKTEKQNEEISAKNQKRQTKSFIPFEPKNFFSSREKVLQIFVSLIILFAVVWLISAIIKPFLGNSENSQTTVSSTKSNNLIKLAQEHYGNAAFWIYIFDKNRDKLSSPFEVPPDTEIEFPNLKEDYNVDKTDSMEIRRANFRAESILREFNLK